MSRRPPARRRRAARSGSSGRALVLLSGGLDSPVAAYRMMKRGLRCDFVHFSGRPFTGPESVYKAYALAGRLDRFQGDSRLFVVSFGAAQRRLATAGAGRLQVLSQRRLMVKVASELGRREGAEALVTGDSLGQVASQTLPNLALVEEAAELPLLRPLIDRDKSEIVEIAKQLGTYEISILPDEDCCQLFSSKLAVTRGHTDDLRAHRAHRRHRGDGGRPRGVGRAPPPPPRARAGLAPAERGTIVSARAPIAQPDRATPS